MPLRVQGKAPSIDKGAITENAAVIVMAAIRESLALSVSCALIPTTLVMSGQRQYRKGAGGGVGALLDSDDEMELGGLTTRDAEMVVEVSDEAPVVRAAAPVVDFT